MTNAGGTKYGTKVLFILLVALFFAAGSVRLWGRLFFPLNFRVVVEEQSRRCNLDPLLVMALIREESSFKPNAVSHRGALGLMQVMPETGAWIAGQLGEEFKREQLLTPSHNVRYGTWFLQALFTEFGRDKVKALAAYNAGSNRVHEWLSEDTWDGSLSQLERLPYTETRRYVIKILRSYRIYCFLYREG